MQSIIFQIEEKPIDKSKYINKEVFYNDFVPSIASYVDNSKNREEDILWLIESIKSYGVNYDSTRYSIIFNKGFKNNFFECQFIKMKKLANEITLDEFSENNISGHKLYSLKKSIENKFGFYIYNSGYCQTLDEFVRSLAEEKTYYFGNTIIYHY